MGRARGITRLADEGPGRRSTNRRRGAATKWSDARLRHELEAFLGDREDWPTRAEFLRAERADLWLAVCDHGGFRFWADQLGRTVSDRQRMQESVSEQALVDEARAVIAEFGRLPGEDTLREMGRAHLATAVKYAGGAKKYRAKYGL